MADQTSGQRRGATKQQSCCGKWDTVGQSEVAAQDKVEHRWAVRCPASALDTDDNILHGHRGGGYTPETGREPRDCPRIRSTVELNLKKKKTAALSKKLIFFCVKL